MTITPLPPAPDRTDPTTFSDKADAFVGALPAFGTEANALAADVNLKQQLAANSADASAGSAAQSEASANEAEQQAFIAQAAANFRGFWTVNLSYETGDTVVFQGERYVALRNNTAQTPSTATLDWFLLVAGDAEIRTPTPIEPLQGASGVLPATTLEASPYAPNHSVDARVHRLFEVFLASDTNFTSPVFEEQIDADSTTVDPQLDTNEVYVWRCRDVTEIAGETVNSDFMAVQQFTTADISVNQPTLTVEGAPNDVPETPELTTSAFDTTPSGEDTHAATDWEVRKTTDNSLVFSSLNDTVNLLSITVAAGNLDEDEEYLFRARHIGTTFGAGPFAEVTASTVETFVGPIGIAGAQGFGVGVYPDTLPTDFSNLSGNEDPANANYGNYQYTDGSVMVFVPKFYYRIGSSSSPNFATYGANAIDIADSSNFTTTAAANTAGYALHRAFIDGGSEKLGFFIDKYLCSQNAGLTAGRSVQNGVPISLTTNTAYTRSDGMSGCTGILADAVVLSRARGTGFNTATIFMYSALALLSLAHGQAATGTANCAWFDSGGVTNFPKGCNNNALGDVDDATLSFTTAGDSGNANKPLTGSASDLAKTAHNGQLSGVVDINGAMWEVALGITAPGTSATSTTDVTTDPTGYILKESVAFSSLTAGWNTGTDAWGNTTHINGLYDSFANYYWWTATTATKFGNGTNQVFSESTSGIDWLKAAGGVAVDSNGMSAGGTNLFGVDSNFASRRHNMFPFVGGDWLSSAGAGVFARGWVVSRSDSDSAGGFRAAAFGN
jgi:hypothetical protein